MSEIYPIVAHKGYSRGPNIEVSGGGASRAAGWMTDVRAVRGAPMVSANQLTSLSAMIAFLAVQSKQSEFRIERRLSDRFNIPNAKCLPAHQFDSAIRYLVDDLPAQER